MRCIIDVKIFEIYVNVSLSGAYILSCGTMYTIHTLFCDRYIVSLIVSNNKNYNQLDILLSDDIASSVI